MSEVPKGWRVVPFEPIPSSSTDSDRERVLSEPAYGGWIWPEKGEISAAKPGVLEHELAHITLGHVHLGKPIERKRGDVSWLSKDLDAWVYPLARGRISLDTFLQGRGFDTISSTERGSLRRQVAVSLRRLYSRGYVTNIEVQDTIKLFGGWK